MKPNAIRISVWAGCFALLIAVVGHELFERARLKASIATLQLDSWRSKRLEKVRKEIQLTVSSEARLVADVQQLRIRSEIFRSLRPSANRDPGQLAAEPARTNGPIRLKATIDATRSATGAITIHAITFGNQFSTGVDPGLPLANWIN